MANDDYDPLSLFCAALRTVLGWAVVIFTTLLVGLWLGISIGSRAFASPDVVLIAVLVAPFAWLFFPEIAIAFAVSLAACYLPLKYDSTRLRLGAAAANLLAWLAIAAWVFGPFRKR